MGSNPINLTVRFILELAALIALGVWGWNTGEGVMRFLLTFGIPMIAGVLWGTFNVRGDPSRSGKAPIPVPGALRLLLELSFFALATWTLFDLGKVQLGWILAIAVLVHYTLSYDRILWLLKH